MEKIPIFAGCHLATHPKSLFCGSKGTGLSEMVLLATPSSGFVLEKLPCSSVLMMSTHRPNTGLTFPINEMKNLTVSPWDLFSSSPENLVVLSGLTLLLVHGKALWLLFLLFFLAFLVLTVTSFVGFRLLCCWIGHFIDAHRRLHTWHRSQVEDILLFFVVRENNDPAAVSHLCFWRHCPVLCVAGPDSPSLCVTVVCRFILRPGTGQCCL